jgi:hypothetical protein
MSSEIVKSDFKIYYSRMSGWYFIKAFGQTHYFETRRLAEAFLAKQKIPKL